MNGEYEIAYLVAEPTPENIAEGINKLLTDDAYHERLAQNCLQAREKYCWQHEAQTLLNIYDRIAR